jgi:tRNA G18 (ribose-2'-O)-methylase SpoU
VKKLTYEEILKQRPTIEQYLKRSKNPVSVMLDNIRSLYNVGSIFRTCDAAAVDELILTGYTPHPPRKEIDKTALGATATVQWKYFEDIKEAIAEQHKKKHQVIAVELTDTARDYDSLQLNDYPLCLVLGNELTGIDDDVLELCDSAIIIPMYGVKHSLNVGVAAGIAIYEAVKYFKK